AMSTSPKFWSFWAPEVFLLEAANALTKAERQRLIPVGLSTPLHTKISASLPVLHPNLRLVGRALALSSQTRSGFYDCLYVALAEREQCDFVTTDERLARNLQARFPFIKLLASLP